MFKISITLRKKDYPSYLVEALNKIESNKITKYWIKSIVVDKYFERLYIELNSTSIMLYNLKAWATMEAYYGMQVFYNEGLFSIGGTETEELSSKTLLGLITKLEKRCNESTSWYTSKGLE